MPDDGEGLRNAARSLYRALEDIDGEVTRASSAWSALPGVFRADALTPLLSPLMDPAVRLSSQLRAAAEMFYRVAAAASDQLDGLKHDHDSLVSRIAEFHRSAPGKAEAAAARQAASGDTAGATAIASWQDVPALVADEAALRWKAANHNDNVSTTLTALASQINAIDTPGGMRLEAVGTVRASTVVHAKTTGHWWDQPLRMLEVAGEASWAVVSAPTREALPYVEDVLSTAGNATLSVLNTVGQHGGRCCRDDRWGPPRRRRRCDRSRKPSPERDGSRGTGRGGYGRRGVDDDERWCGTRQHGRRAPGRARIVRRRRRALGDQPRRGEPEAQRKTSRA
ncbi:MAG TPA: hypothetical protein VGC45_15050 [Gryllotalpicola sp.]